MQGRVSADAIVHLTGNKMTEATDAYRIPGYTSNCVAVYLPQFHQIWTNPQHDRKTVDRALREEVIHATQTCFRPSGLLPTLNF